MKIIFFDTQATLLAKNFLKFTDYCYKKDHNFQAVFVSADSAKVDFEFEEKSKNDIENRPYASFRTIKMFNKNKIESFLQAEGADFFMIDCYRIVDQLWLSIAKKYCLSTLMLQHGMEIQNLSYKITRIWAKTPKVVRYFSAVYNLSKVINISFFRLSKNYIQSLYGGKNKKLVFFGDSTIPDESFVYSSYYENYYKNVMGFAKTKFHRIRYPDLDLADTVLEKPLTSGVCYITQTLVEDGRLDKKEFLDLMNSYKNIAKNFSKFYIKVHPRSELDSYKVFEESENVIITRDFPHCDLYITHYSSMAFVAFYLKKIVVLHELKNHKTPDIFKKVADYIIKTPSEFDFLNAEKNNHSNISDIMFSGKLDNNKIIYNRLTQLLN